MVKLQEVEDIAGGVNGGAAARQTDDDLEKMRKSAAEASCQDAELTSKWKDRMRETNMLTKQVKLT